MRHGEPVLAGRLLGHTDCPATPAGIAACRAAAARLEVTEIVSSDLLRAHACAQAIAGHSLPVRLDPRWRELDFGAWDGCLAAEVDSQALARFWDDPDAAPPPGGECWSALVARVGAALAEITEPALVVTHAGAMRAALASACGFDARQVWAFDLPYAGILSLRLWPGPPPAGQIVGLTA
ncbi:histidine phosphatase family protein [uncultured Sphingomonas sp.]|uniref:histidine phosphatase family protein n=1 Tax=uncultured Sphingomonas sp. TaxID=158754 RepID=UPI0025D9D776|nr:histidine phosphatase family protein [uncultured Sphingomonas sp.]